MSEKTIIQCPNCGTEIDVQDIISHQLEEDLKKEFNAKLAEQKKKFENETETLKKEKEEFEKLKAKEDELFNERLESKIKEEKEKL